MKFSWIKAESDKRTGIQSIVSLFIRPKQSGIIATQAHFVDKQMASEGYHSNKEILNLNLQFSPVSHNAVSLERMVLWQNAPNPFNYSTSIRYTIPENGKVNWTLTDVTGRILESWSRQETKGDHELIINKNHLGSTGIYYYKMEYNGYFEVKKFILME